MTATVQIIMVFAMMALALVAALRPFRLGRFPVNIITGSLLGLSMLLIAGVISVSTIQAGIVGNGQLKPWQIIIIFFTAAYVSIRTDITGIFDYIAYKIVRRANGNGPLLMLLLFIFACILTIFTSNDIVILTLTPIIFYLGRHAHLNVIPLLFAEFFGANTTSMLLYIGNPTNIIVGNALRLDFWEFTQVMALPTLVAAIANYLLLCMVFKRDISRTYTLKTDSTFSVSSWADAITCTALLLAMLVTLALSRQTALPIWMVTSAFALIFIVKDIPAALARVVKINSSNKTIGCQNQVEESKCRLTIKRMPWGILPFIVCFFIFVAALKDFGVIHSTAALMANQSQTPAGAIASMGLTGITLANVMNNQPMTIFLTHVLISDSYAVSPATFRAGAYALVIASNLGANITLIGALAGLMWQSILKTKGLSIRYRDFLQKGLLITPIVTALALATLHITLKLTAL